MKTIYSLLVLALTASASALLVSCHKETTTVLDPTEFTYGSSSSESSSGSSTVTTPAIYIDLTTAFNGAKSNGGKFSYDMAFIAQNLASGVSIQSASVVWGRTHIVEKNISSCSTSGLNVVNMEYNSTSEHYTATVDTTGFKYRNIASYILVKTSDGKSYVASTSLYSAGTYKSLSEITNKKEMLEVVIDDPIYNATKDSVTISAHGTVAYDYRDIYPNIGFRMQIGSASATAEYINSKTSDQTVKVKDDGTWTMTLNTPLKSYAFYMGFTAGYLDNGAYTPVLERDDVYAKVSAKVNVQ